MKKYLFIFLLCVTAKAQTNTNFLWSVSNLCYHLGFNPVSGVYTNPILVSNRITAQIFIGNPPTADSVQFRLITPISMTTNYFEIIGSNGTIIPFNIDGFLNLKTAGAITATNGYWIPTNTYVPGGSAPPPSPQSRGCMFMWNSNGANLYILSSGVNGNAWVKTNLLTP